ncbi:glycosyltransferase family 2 protein [Jaapia argillacea MUCL 33604]|uniref:chitin synthase n=1 Tax=Jaapia argillacea MUCL 33604 TaxID=933084 RepID=A0A067Q7D5_9AGAM|nr:glycosyltransferase family 2 protein [Jaapia argillacea MUCL 33604]
MDYRDQRPPRAARPPSSLPPPPPSYADQQQYQQRSSNYSNSRPPLNVHGQDSSKITVSFQHAEQGDRRGLVDNSGRIPTIAYNNTMADPESGDSRVLRKKSLVRPDREKIEPGHRQWHYRTHAAQLENEGRGRGVMPSTTGNVPELRRGKSLLGREEDVHESGLALFKRSTLRRRKSAPVAPPPQPTKKKGCFDNIGPGPKDGWFIYCYLLTCCIPPFLLSLFGIRTPEAQRAWREKMGLLSIIGTLMAGVGFLTFGFTISVCGTPPNRYHTGSISNGSVIIHGFDYDFTNFKHPKAGNTFNGETNPLLQSNWSVAGNDISFMFQNVNENCKGYITKAANSSITGSNGNLDWYFPCNVYNQYGTSPVNLTNYESSYACHVSTTARSELSATHSKGQVYYTWDDVKASNRNLAVFESNVLDFGLLKWLNKAQVNYPPIFDTFANPNGTYNGKDLTSLLLRTNQRQLGHCLEDIITVGFIDTNSIGCVASQVVLYVSLVFIIGVVGIRFSMAVMFAWFFSSKLGVFNHETYEQKQQRMREIENWSNDIYRPAPAQYRPNVNKYGLAGVKKGGKGGKGGKKGILPTTSRFTPTENLLRGGRPTTAYGMLDNKRNTYYPPAPGSVSGKGAKLTPPDTPVNRGSHSSTSLAEVVQRGSFVESNCPFPLVNVVPQPSPDEEPFGYPLVHTIALVTAYSESVEGLRTTLDSLATTDYPNSHKVIMVIADGMVKGAGNDLSTPDIVLTMMKELVIPADEVEPHSYVAIADGHKRHNMAKVYAGFYDYDDATMVASKQQRVPMVLIAKCGNPLEAKDSKPGNRGKRDSQIVLMSFLQKVMFDERMTTMEYELFNSMWRVTGVSPDRYELVLCVDADTKVFPDSLTRMVACMVQDEEIMGLCGETKIANKADSWVTMMQVFEYYISHHMTKAFESMFGGVTCLPGCFSMYRIKAPKGSSGYWVPILANPDIVEHYSENVVDTLHKKNLLLLGEDRYLTTLMLKTFPKRKNMFCPSAVCKTIVPDTFKVLLSQRRRWINSTIHNLAELLLVRDLCGTFCFSMQFVVGMELAGTLVLPAAISFTLYLIIISIIPGGTNTTIPLVLLGIVLGLPGVLIVITSRKVAYIGWMVVYLLSLPVWNGILPAYAFWHFDDFSWGQTRKISGEEDEANHGDKDGEFDSTHIVMKRWAEFERERRWMSGTQSRDSTFNNLRSNSPKRAESNRFSMVSTSDTYVPGSQGYDSSTYDSGTFPQRPRYDSNQLLVTPTPLSVSRGTLATASSSTMPVSRTSDEGPYASDSNQRLISPPIAQEQQYGYQEDPYEHLPSPAGRYQGPSFEAQIARAATGNNGVLRSSTVSSPYPGETENPYFTSQPHVAGYDDQYNAGYGAEYDEPAPRVRGVSLTDRGPVSNGPDGVRRVSRSAARRSTSQVPPQNRYSRTSMYSPPPPSTLPPGAAPPQPSVHGQHDGYR